MHLARSKVVNKVLLVVTHLHQTCRHSNAKLGALGLSLISGMMLHLLQSIQALRLVSRRSVGTILAWSICTARFARVLVSSRWSQLIFSVLVKIDLQKLKVNKTYGMVCV